MKTKQIDAREEKDLAKILKPAAKAITEGKLVLMPTETVYGLAANALDSQAVKSIFMAKGRAQDNPLIVHIADFSMLDNLVEEIGEIEQKLMNVFWPGPLTIILKKKDIIPSVTSAGLDTVGIRMPSNQIARVLIQEAKVPIAAPSANISGRPSGTNLADIRQEFEGKVAYRIDGGECDIGLESTVVRVIDKKVHILRPGKITAEQIAKVTGDVVIDKHVLGKIEKDEIIRSPGMKYRHYAPKIKCMLIYGTDKEKMIKYINQQIQANPNSLVMGRKENLPYYQTDKKLELGTTLEEVSKNIFTLLRKVDTYQVDIALIEGVEKQGLGLAIMNRLLRACEYNYIEIL